MTMTNIGRAEHRLLSRQIVEELRDLGARHGIDFSIKGGSYGGIAHFNLAVEPVVPAGGKSLAQREFEAFAGYFGLKPEHFGQTFVFQGKSYKITGIRPSAPKYAILAERVFDGRDYKFPASLVARQFPSVDAAAA